MGVLVNNSDIITRDGYGGIAAGIDCGGIAVPAFDDSFAGIYIDQRIVPGVQRIRIGMKLRIFRIDVDD